MSIPDSWGPATVLVVALVVIGALAGAVITITNPTTLAFPDYLAALVGFAGSVGLLGIGRGVMNRPPAIDSSTVNGPSATDVGDHDQDAVDRLRQEQDAQRIG